MFGIGGSELVVIIFVVLLIFGPGRIPEIARVFKRGYQEWSKVRSQVDVTISEIKQEIDLKSHFEDSPPGIKPAIMSAARRAGSEKPTPEAASRIPVPEHDDYLAAQTDALYENADSIEPVPQTPEQQD